MNNAGIAEQAKSWEGIDKWHKVFDVNLFGCVFILFLRAKQRAFVNQFIYGDDHLQGLECAANVRQGEFTICLVRS